MANCEEQLQLGVKITHSAKNQKAVCAMVPKMIHSLILMYQSLQMAGISLHKLLVLYCHALYSIVGNVHARVYISPAVIT